MSAKEVKVLVVGDEQSLPLFRMAGMSTLKASNQTEAEEAVKRGVEEGYGLIIVLKHVISDEESLRRIVAGTGSIVFVLPTKWSKAEPINIEKLLAEALGLG